MKWTKIISAYIIQSWILKMLPKNMNDFAIRIAVNVNAKYDNQRVFKY